MQMRLEAKVLALLCLFFYAPGRVDDNPLFDTWRLKSFVREVTVTGQRYNQIGEHPDGYLSYAADGRMLVFFVSDKSRSSLSYDRGMPVELLDDTVAVARATCLCGLVLTTLGA